MIGMKTINGKMVKLCNSVRLNKKKTVNKMRFKILLVTKDI